MDFHFDNGELVILVLLFTQWLVAALSDGRITKNELSQLRQIVLNHALPSLVAKGVGNGGASTGVNINNNSNSPAKPGEGK